MQAGSLNTRCVIQRRTGGTNIGAFGVINKINPLVTTNFFHSVWQAFELA